jgi:hypothetical protein
VLRPFAHALQELVIAAGNGRVKGASASSACSTVRPIRPFIALRRELDPQGVFLNNHLRPLFA